MLQRRYSAGRPGLTPTLGDPAQRAYPSVKAERDFLLLPGGYVLKTAGGSRRKDRQAGQALTYPALVLTER